MHHQRALHGHGAPICRIDSFHLRSDKSIGYVAQSCSAIKFGDGGAKKAHGTHLLHLGVVEMIFVAVCHDDAWLEFLLAECVGCFLNGYLQKCIRVCWSSIQKNAISMQMYESNESYWNEIDSVESNYKKEMANSCSKTKQNKSATKSQTYLILGQQTFEIERIFPIKFRPKGIFLLWRLCVAIMIIVMSGR